MAQSVGVRAFGRLWEVQSIVFYVFGRLWEAQSIVFYVSWRLWDIHSYVCYVSGRLGGVPPLTTLRSQAGLLKEDLTRAVLTQIIIERQPDKMALFPTDMLHFIVRSNDAMSAFLRDYFQHSLTYLSYLQQHATAAKTLTKPMHWFKFWLEGTAKPSPETADAEIADAAPPPPQDAEALAAQLQQLELRLRELEVKDR